MKQPTMNSASLETLIPNARRLASFLCGQSCSEAMVRDLALCFIHSSVGSDALLLEEIRTLLCLSREEPVSYDRWEFLGDSILGYAVSLYLVETRRHAKEGELTKIKGLLVSSATLSKVFAPELGISMDMVVHRMSADFNRDAVLEDVVEAVVGVLGYHLGAGWVYNDLWKVTRRVMRKIHKFTELGTDTAFFFGRIGCLGWPRIRSGRISLPLTQSRS